MMKFKYSIVILVTTFIFGCEKDFLKPQEYITPEYVYNPRDSSGQYAEMVLNNLYSFLPDGFNRINNVVLGTATDDAIPSDNYNGIEVLSGSILTSVEDNPDGSWFKSYEAIKNCNLFLSNIDKLPLNPGIIKRWRSEARFIRAMSYFELIKRYGGVPIILDEVYSPNDNVEIKRNSYSECVQYIKDEIDSLKGDLSDDPIQDVNKGRITKGAALALKSRLLLYAASPLNNPDNDLDKWKDAADAAEDVIEYGKFDLENDFISVFTENKNKEVILSFQRAKTSDLERQNAPVGFAEPNESQGYVSPTLELVNSFPMKNGLAIDDPNSGYNPNFPYLNRDPRLNATVFYNGSMWLGRTVQTFEGGLDKPNDIRRQTKTGFYMRKFLADYSTGEAYGNESHNFPIFRFSEILLNYAEAVNEYSGPTQMVYDMLDSIRRRAGIDPGLDGHYGIKADLDRDQMREVIHNERRIELAFEEHRFWDVRRWKEGNEAFNRVLHGVKITEIGIGNYGYEVVPVSEMIFKEKMYLYPIPFSEANDHSVIEQNPGWR